MKNKRVQNIEFKHAYFRNIIWAKSEGLCWYCGNKLLPFGRTSKSFAIDHFIPIDLNGTDEIENLVPSCAKCNAQKNNFNIEDYRSWIGNNHVFWFEGGSRIAK